MTFAPPTGPAHRDPRYAWARARLNARYASNVSAAKSPARHVARYAAHIDAGGCPVCFAKPAESCFNADGKSYKGRWTHPARLVP